MIPKFDNYDALLCPCCDSPYTRQFAVAVFARKEDQKATVTTIPTGGVKAPRPS